MAQAQTGVNRFYLLLGAVAIAGVGALLYLMNKPKSVSIPVNVAVLPADTAGFRGYLLGSDTAKVEVTEYADYQCPVCQDFETVQFPSIREQLIQTGIVRWRYRDFPLDMHPHARVAAHAAACADEQGKVWEMHDALYRNQPQWSAMRTAAGAFSDYARDIGLDVARYDECMKSAKFAGRIQASVDEGVKVGVSGTPNFLIGGTLYRSTMPSDSIKAIVLRSLPPAAPASPPPAQ
jgi:protein-disulfide isomerase